MRETEQGLEFKKLKGKILVDCDDLLNTLQQNPVFDIGNLNEVRIRFFSAIFLPRNHPHIDNF